MQTAAIVLSALFGASLATPTETLIFMDDFNTLDSKIWSHENTLGGGGNGEF
jgi:beta-glucanase (GH16 family)